MILIYTKKRNLKVFLPPDQKETNICNIVMRKKHDIEKDYYIDHRKDIQHFIVYLYLLY